MKRAYNFASAPPGKRTRTARIAARPAVIPAAMATREVTRTERHLLDEVGDNRLVSNERVPVPQEQEPGDGNAAHTSNSSAAHPWLDSTSAEHITLTLQDYLSDSEASEAETVSFPAPINPDAAPRAITPANDLRSNINEFLIACSTAVTVTDHRPVKTGSSRYAATDAHGAPPVSVTATTGGGSPEGASARGASCWAPLLRTESKLMTRRPPPIDPGSEIVIFSDFESPDSALVGGFVAC
jgi:hypothetical protein